MSQPMEAHPEVVIRQAKRRELEWINVQYRAIGFLPSKEDGEWQALAEVDAVKAGVGRMVDVGSALELGGMWVLPEFRKLGLARRLVEYLLEHRVADRRVFCLPFAHLAPFYQKFGFTLADPTDRTVPEELRAKQRWCLEQYHDRQTLLFELRE